MRIIAYGMIFIVFLLMDIRINENAHDIELLKKIEKTQAIDPSASRQIFDAVKRHSGLHGLRWESERDRQLAFDLFRELVQGEQKKP